MPDEESQNSPETTTETTETETVDYAALFTPEEVTAKQESIAAAKAEEDRMAALTDEERTAEDTAAAEAKAAEESDKAPDEYADFKLPDGILVDKAMLDEAKPLLKELNLSEADIRNEGAPYWLTTLADTAKSLQVLDLSLTEVEDVQQHVLEELARRCHTLRLCEALKIDHVLPIVKAADTTVRRFGIGCVTLIARIIS